MAEMRFDSLDDRRQSARELIGARIRRARLDAAMSQTELARQMGVAHPSTVSDWERGAANLTAGQLIDVARILGRPVAWFYGEAAGRLAPAEIVDAVRETFPDQPAEAGMVVSLIDRMFRQSSRAVREKGGFRGKPGVRENDHSRQSRDLLTALA